VGIEFCGPHGQILSKSDDLGDKVSQYMYDGSPAIMDLWSVQLWRNFSNPMRLTSPAGCDKPALACKNKLERSVAK